MSARFVYPLALNPEVCYNSGMDAINKMLTGAGGRLRPYLNTTSHSLSFLPSLVPARAYFFLGAHYDAVQD